MSDTGEILDSETRRNGQRDGKRGKETVTQFLLTLRNKCTHYVMQSETLLFNSFSH